MEALLRTILPKLLGAVTFQIHPHQGKPELLKLLPSRLLGYSHWLPQSWRILVIIDRDDDDCMALKAALEGIAAQVGLTTRSSGGTTYRVVNRLAIEELEAWYFGDWGAVMAAYPGISPHVPQQAKYRVPDAIAGGTWEAFERILKRAGYFRTGLRKVEAARLIGTEMDPSLNRSASFRALRVALSQMAVS